MRKTVRKNEDKFLAVCDDDDVVAKGQTIQEVVDLLRDEHRDCYNYDADQSLSYYIESRGIQIYEVKSILEVEEKITRTIYVNGEIASL